MLLSLRPLFACIVWERRNTLTYMPVKSTSSSPAAMMCSLEQPLSLSCIVILNVNQLEVTFLWRDWSHQPYVDCTVLIPHLDVDHALVLLVVALVAVVAV